MHFGSKIDAIRMYREQTGAGLREPVDAVNALERVGKLPASRNYGAAAAVDADLKADLWALMQNGQKIEAIKLYRERTGASLRTAKDVVDALSREHGVAAGGAGCLSVFVLFLVLPALLFGLIV